MIHVKNVAVGISGGVDSAVAALLLKKRGYNVIGVYMKNWDLVDENGICSTSEDLEYAKYTCNQIDIPFHEVNFVKEYWNNVFVAFTKEYEDGYTPNPDILCNKYIKFNAFSNYAFKKLRADAIATGHYAKTSFGNFLENYKPQTKAKLLVAKDIIKDQTFFLSQIPQETLKKTIFPLGDLHKSEVKKIAEENDMKKLSRKPESMGICFIGSRNFQTFIDQYIKPKPGKFINMITGKEEGKHDGIHMWTVGQRCRIKGFSVPRFVVKKDPTTANIWVVAGTNHSLLYSYIFVTEKPYWIAEPPNNLYYGCKVHFKFQHVKSTTNCQVISIKNDNLLVIIDKPLRALTQGQYAVFYQENECLGSARITHVGPSLYSLGLTVPENYEEYAEKCNSETKSVNTQL